MSTQWVTIEMTYNDSVRSSAISAKFFALFDSLFPEFKFKFMGQWEPLRAKFDPEKATVEWEKNRGERSAAQHGNYIFHGNEPVPFYAFISWHGPGTHRRWADRIAVTFDDALWAKGEAEEMTKSSVAILGQLGTMGNPLYGRGFHESEFEAKDYRQRVLPDGRVSRESISLTPREGIIDLFWANYFGKPYLDVFGEQALGRVSCTQNERVGNGFLLVFARDPFRWNDQAVLSLQKKTKAELDRGAFLDISKDFRPNLNIPPETTLQP